MNLLKKQNNEKVESTKGLIYYTPDCDIYETENEYKIIFELPGIEKEDIKLKVEKDILTVTAECNKEADNEYYCLRNEFDYSGFKRSFNLNGNVDTDKIDAELNNGVLTLTLPKKEEKKTKEIEIKIS